MKRAFLLFFICLASASFLSAADNLLDGITCEGDSGEKGKQATEKDTLIFKDGMFRSTACDEYGFKPAPYKATKEGDTINFETEAASDKEGAIKWTGKVTGTNCDVTSVWTKAGQKDIEYWFKGTAKK